MRPFLFNLGVCLLLIPTGFYRLSDYCVGVTKEVRYMKNPSEVGWGPEEW